MNGEIPTGAETVNRAICSIQHRNFILFVIQHRELLKIRAEKAVEDLREGDAQATENVGRVGVNHLELLRRRRIDHNPKRKR